MTDYMLRATTESDLDDAVIAAGVAQEVTDADGEVLVLPINGITLDRIGPIPAQLDPEGEVIKDGDTRYHANIRVAFDLTAAQVAMLPVVSPAPSVPYRVFA